MKDEGFTLIELLAVIVILAIIALIATPIVLDIIEDSKESSTKRSAELYLNGVEQAIARYQLNGKEVTSGTYYVMENGNICTRELSDNKCTGEEITVTVDGTKPNGGIITITEGEIKSINNLYIDKKYINKKDNEIVLSDEKIEVLCKANTTKVSALVWGGNANPLDLSSYNSEEVGLLASESGSYTPGATYTCNVGDGERTFYVLGESGDNVLLILGTNLGSIVAWSEDGSNHKNEDESQQAVTAKAYLKEQTSRWTKLNQSQINLPTYDQIYKAAGNKSSDFPTWLNSYTDENMAYGYWTSTPDETSAYYAWVVYLGGIFYSNSPMNISVRPVITISKSQLG